MKLFKNPLVIFLLLMAALAFFYGQSFFAPFYREDAEFLRVSLPQDLFRAVPAIHYHPISIQLFYFFSKVAFGSNYILYHVVLFAFYAGALYFAYKLAEALTGSARKALLSVFFVAFNISLFPIFYWIAVSYFAISAFFVFAAVYLFQKAGPKAALASIALTLCALGSNEAAIIIFGLFWLVALYKNSFPLRLWILSAVGLIYFVFRFIIFKLPVQEAYAMEINLGVIKTFQWYIFRALNLPEGIRFSGDLSLTILFAAFVVLLGISAAVYGKAKGKNLRLCLFGFLWLVVGAAPFYLLPHHMSAYYLTYAFFGVALIFSELVASKRILILLCTVVYLLLAMRGLAFLERTHWIILQNAGEPQKFYTIEEAYDYRN